MIFQQFYPFEVAVELITQIVKSKRILRLKNETFGMLHSSSSI